MRKIVEVIRCVSCVVAVSLLFAVVLRMELAKPRVVFVLFGYYCVVFNSKLQCRIDGERNRKAFIIFFFLDRARALVLVAVVLSAQAR
jgi:hypothetical protein